MQSLQLQGIQGKMQGDASTTIDEKRLEMVCLLPKRLVVNSRLPASRLTVARLCQSVALCALKHALQIRRLHTVTYVRVGCIAFRHITGKSRASKSALASSTTAFCSPVEELGAASCPPAYWYLQGVAGPAPAWHSQTASELR